MCILSSHFSGAVHTVTELHAADRTDSARRDVPGLQWMERVGTREQGEVPLHQWQSREQHCCRLANYALHVPLCWCCAPVVRHV